MEACRGPRAREVIPLPDVIRADIMECVALVFYGDLMMAALKALDMH